MPAFLPAAFDRLGTKARRFQYTGKRTQTLLGGQDRLEQTQPLSDPGNDEDVCGQDNESK